MHTFELNKNPYFISMALTSHKSVEVYMRYANQRSIRTFQAIASNVFSQATPSWFDQGACGASALLCHERGLRLMGLTASLPGRGPACRFRSFVFRRLLWRRILQVPPKLHVPQSRRSRDLTIFASCGDKRGYPNIRTEHVNKSHK